MNVSAIVNGASRWAAGITIEAAAGLRDRRSEIVCHQG